MNSTSVHSTATTRYWMQKTTNATFGIDKRELVQVALLQFHGETVHTCQCFSEVSSECHRCFCALFVQWSFPIFLLSLELLRGWAIRVVFLCYFVHRNACLFSPPNLELRITMCWISKEAIENSIKYLFETSPPRNVCCEMLFLCFIQFWGAVSSTSMSHLLDNVLDWETSNRHWWKCWLARCFVTNRLELLLDEDDSRFLSRVREHWSFRLVSQLHVEIQTQWSRCLCPRTAWTNWTVIHKHVSLF